MGEEAICAKSAEKIAGFVRVIYLKQIYVEITSYQCRAIFTAHLTYDRLYSLHKSSYTRFASRWSVDVSQNDLVVHEGMRDFYYQCFPEI